MDRHPRLIALFAGAIGATGFAPLGLWPLMLLALAVLAALVMHAKTVRRAALIGWLFGVGHFSVGLNWIAGSFLHQDAMPAWLGYFAVVALSLYLAAFPALGMAVAKALAPRGGWPFVLVLAAAWIVSEYGRATVFTGFAWNPVAVAFVSTWLSGWARLTGTYGLSGLVVLGAGAAALAINDMRARAIGGAGALAAVAGGWALLIPNPADTGRIVRIAQPNINLDTIRDPFAARTVVERLARLSGTPGRAPRMVFWSEGAVPDVYEVFYDQQVRDAIATLLGPDDRLLAGATRVEYRRVKAAGGVGTESRAIGAQNSVFLLDAAGRIGARYDKAHLVPYGEYLPMRALLTPLGLARLVPGDLDFWAGPGPRSLNVPGFGRVGLQICYEIVFSGQVIDRKNRPDMLFNPSIDAWFGTWGPPQHLAQAQLRAIEEGLPIVRATPTGISAVIDARGTLRHTVALNTEGFIEAKLPGALTPTPFAMFGNLLPMALALLFAIAGVALARRQRYGRI